MRLTETEYNHYLSIQPKLIYYVGQQKKLIPETISFEEFMEYSAQDKFPIRNALYENINLLNHYITENASSLSEEDKAVIANFKQFRRGTFYIIKLTKKHALFLGEQYVYAVYALNDPFQDFWENKDLPVMVSAVLLPYKGKIIYDGMLSMSPVYFGGGIRQSIQNKYILAEGKYGIITTLPEKIEEEQLKNSLKNELIAMLKTKASRAYNEYQIEDLLEKHPELMPVYKREWGRINSRKKKKELKNLGIKKQFYAICDDVIITSAHTQKELEIKVAALISEKDHLQAIFYFKV